MVIEMDGYVIELDARVLHPGHAAIGMGGPWEYSCPGEGPEIEYIAARIIRNGHVREINPEKIVEALYRRLGDYWRDYGTERPD